MLEIIEETLKGEQETTIKILILMAETLIRVLMVLNKNLTIITTEILDILQI